MERQQASRAAGKHTCTCHISTVHHMSVRLTSVPHCLQILLSHHVFARPGCCILQSHTQVASASACLPSLGFGLLFVNGMVVGTSCKPFCLAKAYGCKHVHRGGTRFQHQQTCTLCFTTVPFSGQCPLGHNACAPSNTPLYANPLQSCPP